MQRTPLAVFIFFSIALSLPAYADQDAKQILNAVVKIRATIPKDAAATVAILLRSELTDLPRCGCTALVRRIT